MKKEYQLPSPLSDLLDNKDDFGAYAEYFYSAPCIAVRKLLVEYLEKRLSQSAARSDKSTSFDKPAWSEYQAYNAGGREEDRHLIDLLKR